MKRDDVIPEKSKSVYFLAFGGVESRAVWGWLERGWGFDEPTLLYEKGQRRRVALNLLYNRVQGGTDDFIG